MEPVDDSTCCASIDLLELICGDNEVCSVESFCHCRDTEPASPAQTAIAQTSFDITSVSRTILNTVPRDPGYCLRSTAYCTLAAAASDESRISRSRWDEHAPGSCAPSDGCIPTAIMGVRLERMGPCGFAPRRRRAVTVASTALARLGAAPSLRRRRSLRLLLLRTVRWLNQSARLRASCTDADAGLCGAVPSPSYTLPFLPPLPPPAPAPRPDASSACSMAACHATMCLWKGDYLAGQEGGREDGNPFRHPPPHPPLHLHTHAHPNPLSVWFALSCV